MPVLAPLFTQHLGPSPACMVHCALSAARLLCSNAATSTRQSTPDKSSSLVPTKLSWQAPQASTQGMQHALPAAPTVSCSPASLKSCSSQLNAAACSRSARLQETRPRPSSPTPFATAQDGAEATRPFPAAFEDDIGKQGCPQPGHQGPARQALQQALQALVHRLGDLEEVRDRVLGRAHEHAVPQVHDVPAAGGGAHRLHHARLDRLARAEQHARVHVALHAGFSPYVRREAGPGSMLRCAQGFLPYVMRGAGPGSMLPNTPCMLVLG